MALMFRSVLQNAGGAAELIVTCDSEFAGATISCSDGTTTLNKTCPSSSPYEVTFKIPNSGDWTISATVSGTAYTSDPISVELDYTALLEYGFNWRRWVDTAQFLDSTDYNSLDEVLEDEEAVRELMLEHACVDYMASFNSATPNLEKIIENDLAAKWINNSDYSLDVLGANVAIKALMDAADKYGYGEWVITDSTTTPVTWGPKGNVPVMTSNSAPYGEAFGTSGGESSSGDSYHPFNQSLANYWYPAINLANAYIGYKFVNPIKAKKFTLFISKINGAIRTLNFKFQGSNDGTDWNDLKDFAYTPSAIGAIEEVTYEVNNEDYFLNYRLFTSDVMSTAGDSFAIHTLQFYGRELSVSVPKMDTNTIPYGEITELPTTWVDHADAKNAFDKDPSTFWAQVVDTGVEKAYIGYKFIQPILPKMVVVTCGSPSSPYLSPSSMQVQASNDGDTWVDLGSEDTDIPNTYHTQVKMLDGTTLYKYLRLELGYSSSHPYPYNYLNCSEVQFFGEDYSEKEFEEGTTKKWLYDHGVKPSGALEFYKRNDSAIVEDDGNSLYVYMAGNNHRNEIGLSIDLTPYTLLRARVADKMASTYDAYGNGISVSDSISSDTDESLQYYVNTVPDPNTAFALDISSYNQIKCVRYGNGGSTGGARYGNINEFWLE